MTDIKPSGLAEIRTKVSKTISKTFNKFLKSERLRVEEALSLLASDKTIQPDSIRVIRHFYESGDEQKKALFTILSMLEPRKIDYALNQIHAAMDSPEWLIRLRADLHKLLKDRASLRHSSASVKQLRELSDIFTDHFTRIFNFQYLVTRCCSAQNTSIALLKFISEKEGVHPAEHWWNFENRLNSPDHIILSLEHFKMPYVPLVYIEVALSKGLIRRINRIIGEKRRTTNVRDADTAIFYSVNTTFAGLRRIGLGAKMVIRARQYLEENYPGIKNFATLSPIPKFRDYLLTVLADSKHGFSLTRGKIDANKRNRFFSGAEIGQIRSELNKRERLPGGVSISKMLGAVLKDDDWYRNPVLKKAMRHPLTEITRYYLEREKRVKPRTGERTTEAYDPVVSFHLSNGAYIGSINYLANSSERGLRESFGMMLNYIYDSRRLEHNKLLYGTGRVVIKA